MVKLHKVDKLPNKSMITNELPSVDYWDSFMARKKTDETISEIRAKIFTLPKWVSLLLKLRYYLFVKPFGLDTGTHELPALFKNENEIVVGEDDKHLYFRISVMKKKVGTESEIYLTTVVKFNNMWGRTYFLLIKPFHNLVCKSLLNKV